MDTILPSEKHVPTAQRVACVSGVSFVLAGCLSGFLTPVTRAVAVAHVIGLLEGVLLLALGAVWPLFILDAVNEGLALAALLISLGANWLGAVLAALTGASGNQYDPTFTCSLPSKDRGANLAVAVLLNLSTFIVPALTTLLLGAALNSRDRRTQLGVRVSSAITFAVAAWVFIRSCGTEPVAEPLREGLRPGSAEWKQACPFARFH